MSKVSQYHDTSLLFKALEYTLPFSIVMPESNDITYQQKMSFYVLHTQHLLIDTQQCIDTQFVVSICILNCDTLMHHSIVPSLVS